MPLNGTVRIVISLLYAHYPILFYHETSIAMLYLVHNYKNKLECTNMGVTHS